MKNLTPQELVDVQKWRYATKLFDPSKKIPAAAWQSLEDALILSPSSYGIQPWKFLNVTTKEVREKLRPASWGQSQVTDASHYVVLLGKTDVTVQDVDAYVDLMASVLGKPREALASYRNVMLGDFVNGPRHAWVAEWVARQVYIALGNFMTSAASIGVDTCPMEGIDPAKYDEILGLKGSGYQTLVACAAGYRSASDKYASLPKVRFPKETILKEV